MSAQPQDNLVNIEGDGKPIAVEKGSMIIEAADKLGIDIPRFCYHRKLSIAANCRMCLVDVEKAPKPLPACATPVMEGMKVFTESRRAVDAQHGVMEFLLVNHPLDCPICDQGGECELQDVAMGYGRSVSRFSERKRVVKDENLGPLISTDMTRCIHCTRCVRFLEEVAGTRELGGIGRGDRTEIKTFIGRSVDSEMSGNVIDLCPVGALTNKPFRFSARAWELVARSGVAMHDCVGSHLWYHTRRGEVMRAVPRDEESLNEAWLSDRDRFSHHGLKSEDRLLKPMVKTGGEWQETDWETALDAAAKAIKGTIDQHGADQLGVLAAPQNISEDFYLLQKLFRGLGVNNIDHRLRESDNRDDAARNVHPCLGQSIADIEQAKSILLVGSNIRHEQPILGHRVRSAWRLHGAEVMAINAVDYDFRFDLSQKAIVAPQHLAQNLGQVLKAAGGSLEGDAAEWFAGLSVSDTAQAMADSLKAAGDNAWIYLGDLVNQHADASLLRALAQALSAATGAKFGSAVFGNGVGAWKSGFVPHRGVNGGEAQTGLAAHQQFSQYQKGFVLLNLEPRWDTANPAQANSAMIAAENIVALTAYASDDLRENANVLLPVALPQESGGTFHNIEGRAFRFDAAAKAQGEARPTWKVLHVLAQQLGVDGLTHRTFAEVQAELDGVLAPDSALKAANFTASAPQTGEFWRIGDVPMFAGDALVRRSDHLQGTVHAENSVCALNPIDAHALGLSEGQEVRVRQGDPSAVMPLQLLEQVPAGAAWVRSAVDCTVGLGDAIGPITVEGV
ncbi:MAG: NADH-quinone oxidoreductase subunit NuoG [Xanthomonadales bacterium]|nr:NADH-quinone oxidoreductase subunit NuoG [Xanthomonadales bacterium]